MLAGNQTGTTQGPPKKQLRKKAPTVVKPPAGDIASSGGDYGLKEADRAAKSNPTVRKNTRAVYADQPTARKQQIVKNATGATGQNLRHEHDARVTRQQELEHDQAMHDIRTNADIARAVDYVKKHPAVVREDHPHHGLIAAMTGAADLGVKAGHKLANLASDAAPYAALTVAPLVAGSVALVGGKPGKFATKLVKNAARDVVDTPANALTSAYHLGDTAIHDPVKATKMLAQPYIDLVTHPAKSLTDHPVNSVLLAGGVKGGVGRGGGKLLRSTPSKTLRAIGSTERPHATRTVDGTALAESKPYSKDIINKAGQVVGEKVREQRTGSKTKLQPMSSASIRKRVDETVAASEDIRRAHRAEAVSAAQKAASTGAGGRKVKPTAAVTVAAQNIARPGKGLDDYVARIEEQGKALSHHHLSQNKATVKTLKKANAKSKPADVEAAANAVAALSVRQQAELAKRQIIDPAEASRARLVPYAVEHMGARHDPKLGLVNRAGKALDDAEIRADMAKHGFAEPAFVTHAPNKRGAANFYVSTAKAPEVRNGARTGEAVRNGTVDYHPDTIVEQAAKSQGLIDAHDRYQAFVKEFSKRGGSGKPQTFQTYKQAVDAAERLKHHADGTPRENVTAMRPVRVNPFAGRQAQNQAFIDGVEAHGAATAQHTSQAIQDALSGQPAEHAGPWALIPEDAAVRLQEHEAVGAGRRGAVARVANLYGSTFRKNVLAFSPVWLASNVVEAAVRSMIGHVGPRSAYTGYKVMKDLQQRNPELALEVRSRGAGGGNFSLDRRTSVNTQAEHFAGTKLARVATALGKVARTPGPKQLVDLYHVYTDFVFHTLNGRIESGFQTAMLGKALRESPLMSDKVVKLSRQALENAAKGLDDVNTLAELGRAVDDMYGRYGKLTPTLRRAVAAYTPFVAWTIAATRFLYVTLPKDHPVLTSLIASSSEATEEWRKQHGLYFDPFGETPGQAPDWLQGSIPGKNGSHLRVSRYTPFGLIPGGLEGVSGLLLPQLRDVLNAFEGQKWNGAKIHGPGGGDATQAQRAVAAGTALIETAVPGLSLGQAASKGDLGKRVPFRYTQSVSHGSERVVSEPKADRSGLLPPMPAPPSAPQSLPKLPGLP